jgi:hypothetical protein
MLILIFGMFFVFKYAQASTGVDAELILTSDELS